MAPYYPKVLGIVKRWRCLTIQFRFDEPNKQVVSSHIIHYAAGATMFSKFHQHAILTGCVDSFCLVCESHLRSEDEATNHIEKPVHLKNLQACPYFEKFSNDHIRKVKKGYFCEFCNLLLPTAAKTGIHVADPRHNDNKGTQLIKRIGTNVVLLGNILITEQAWNGLISDICAVCNMEFTNLKLHVADQKHLLNLIQKRVEFDGSTVYRKIDDTSFHCLICNAIFALMTVTSHCKEDTHQANVDDCRQNYLDNFENKKVAGTKNGIQNTKDYSKPEVKSEKPNVIQNANDYPKPEVKSQKPNGIQNTKDYTKPEIKSEKPKGVENGKHDQFKPQPSNAGKNKSGEPKTKKSKKMLNCSDLNAFGINIGVMVDESDEEDDCKASCLGGNNFDQQETVPMDTLIKKLAKDFESQANKNMRVKNRVEKLLENANDFEKNGVSINFERDSAFCKKCFKSVDLDIDEIKKHIAEHKNSSKKDTTANTAHTLNNNCSKTELNKLGKKEAEDIKKSTLNVDCNHNIFKEKDQETPQEEIIKLDIRKTKDIVEESDANNALVRFVPGRGTMPAAPEKPKEPTQPPKKEIENITDPAVFAKVHNLTYNKGNSNVFCRTCNKKIPASIKNMQEHISGMAHKTKVARLAQMERIEKENAERMAKTVPTKPMERFIFQTSTVMTVFGVDDVILNDKYCINRNSYYMITTGNRLRCQACEVNLREEDVSSHVDTARHEMAMEDTPVVTSLPTEFVREVRPGLYHCGYCNLVLGPWETVGVHLACAEHERTKRDHNARRDQHLPGILAGREARQDNMIKMALMQQFGMNFF
ncbi:hypothetical protein NE865_02255 [Phthorimaea operculella]|nr:hypothetical protein NE865_02255 [Phthorimaea operculella]